MSFIFPSLINDNHSLWSKTSERYYVAECVFSFIAFLKQNIPLISDESKCHNNPGAASLNVASGWVYSAFCLYICPKTVVLIFISDARVMLCSCRKKDSQHSCELAAIRRWKNAQLLK